MVTQQYITTGDMKLGGRGGGRQATCPKIYDLVKISQPVIHIMHPILQRIKGRVKLPWTYVAVSLYRKY
jgi:hypothetical protein